MKVVAVAGGTGGVGRAIVDHLRTSSLYKVIILGRKAPETEDPQSPFYVVDYGNISATSKLLHDQNVETVISTIAVTNETTSTAQVNLVKAASQSAKTTRFIASEWGILHGEKSPMYAFREAAVTELRRTDLQWTRFEIGYFSDYYGIPHVKSPYTTPMALAIDIVNKKAAIPGTGEETVSFIYTLDLAKFVEAALSLPKWNEVTHCYGNKSTFNKVLRSAEEARGSKFEVTHDSLEKLQRGEVTELPLHSNLYAYFPKPMLQAYLSLFEVWVIEGKWDIPAETSLNLKFPEIQTTKVEEIIGLWKGH